jgi:hypothetical protein
LEIKSKISCRDCISNSKITKQGFYDFESVNGGNLIELIKQKMNCPVDRAFQIAKDICGKNLQPITASIKPVNNISSFSANSANKIKKILSECSRKLSGVQHTYLEDYRGLAYDLSDEILLHPALWHKDQKKTFPAIVIPIRNIVIEIT